MYDIIGDLHGCLFELQILIKKLGYRQNVHPEQRIPVFVGDLVDRGPTSIDTLNYVMDMVKNNLALMVRGNHDDRLLRYLNGRNVTLSHGLKKTIRQIDNSDTNKKVLAEFLDTIPYFHMLDNDKLVVTHGAWKQEFADLDPFSKACRAWCLFMPNKGLGPDGFPIRIDWASERKVKEDSPLIVYGHQPYREVRVLNKTYGIDTGCVFGGKLTCLRYPEMEIVQVDAKETYCDSTRWGVP